MSEFSPTSESGPSHYRGRIAPSPTGHLHLGHAQTFWIAAERARRAGGHLIFRNDDLDRARCRPEFLTDAIDDLHWLKISWSEGPDGGGKFAPYSQSERFPLYRQALEKLHREKLIFPCARSRRDVLEAAAAPHEPLGEMDEPIYPKTFRPDFDTPLPPLEKSVSINWRFRVRDDQTVQFHDRFFGAQKAVAGVDLGDFLVWRKDDTPSYQLACVVDDAAMRITEVVRGADLVTSTFRQILLYEALGLTAPDFFHCPLVNDESGTRLAKRNDALSLRALRAAGQSAESLIEGFAKTYRDLFAMKAKIGVINVSDRASAGVYADTPGQTAVRLLREWLATDFDLDYAVVPDEQAQLEAVLRRMADEAHCCLIVTTGGTGPSPRDVTPEATLAVSEKILPGFGELMRATSLKFVPTAILSRQTAGIRGQTLIVNLPGRPKSIRENLEAAFPAIPYCIDLIGGPRLETHEDVMKVFRPKTD